MENRKGHSTISKDEIKQRLSLLKKADAILRNATLIEDMKQNAKGERTFSVIGHFKDGSAVRVVVQEKKYKG